MAIEDFLTQTAQLLAQVENQVDAMGAVENEPYTVVAANLPCLVRPISASNQPRHNRAELMISHRIYFDADAGFLASRQIQVAGRVFTIIGPVDFNEMGRLIAVDCLEVRE